MKLSDREIGAGAEQFRAIDSVILIHSEVDAEQLETDC